MDLDLTAIKLAPADISDTELAALIDATNCVPPVAYGLLVWIEGACDWEVNRRRELDYPLLPPDAAIDPSEDEVSITAAMVLRDQFAQDSPKVRAFFDALVELLTGGSTPATDFRRRVALHLIGRLGLAKGPVPGGPNPQAGASGNKRQQHDQSQDSLHGVTV